MATLQLEIAHRTAIDDDLAADVAKQAVYAAPGVKSFVWDGPRQNARVELESGADPAGATDKLRRFVSTMLAKHRQLPKQVLRTSPRKVSRPLIGDIEDQLARRGFLRRLGPGQVGLSGPPLAFLRAPSTPTSRPSRASASRPASMPIRP